MEITQQVICFSGKIASGKTSLSKAVATDLECPWVSFGDYVRKIAERLGQDPQNRETLQRIGEELIETDTQSFCRAVLDQCDWKGAEYLVIDGIRHIEVLNELKVQVAPRIVKLIYLYVEEKEQIKRMLKRGRDTIREPQELYRHSTENQQGLIEKNASIVLNAYEPINLLKEKTLEHILIRFN